MGRINFRAREATTAFAGIIRYCDLGNCPNNCPAYYAGCCPIKNNPWEPGTEPSFRASSENYIRSYHLMKMALIKYCAGYDEFLIYLDLHLFNGIKNKRWTN